MSKTRKIRTDVLRPELAHVSDGVAQGCSRFVLARLVGTTKATLAVGCPSLIQMPGGFVICIGLSREQVLVLREQCDEYLRISSEHVS